MSGNRVSLYACVCILLLASCGKSGNDFAQYIPKSTAIVAVFDLKSMNEKLASDSLKMEDFIEAMKTEESGKVAEDYSKALTMWNDLRTAGIDFNARLFVSAPSIDFQKGGIEYEMVGAVSDAKKLEEFLKKLPEAPAITNESGFKMARTSGFAIGWNDKVFVLAGTQETPSANDFGDFDNLEDDSLSVRLEPAAPPTIDLKKYFTLKKEESINSVAAFRDMLDEKADVALFSNNAAASAGNNPLMAVMAKTNELLEGVYSTTLINFNDGDIDMKSTTVAGKKLTDLLKKYAGPVSDLSLLQRHPSDKIALATAFSFKPEFFPAMVKEMGFESLLNMGLTQSNLSIDDFGKALKGDFAVVFSDFSMNANEFGKDAKFKSYEPSGRLVVAVRIGDQPTFDKIIQLGEKSNMIGRSGNRIYPLTNGSASASPDFFAGIENGLLIISNDSLLYADYAAGKASAKLSPELTNAIKGKAMGFYINTPQILNTIPDDVFAADDVHSANVLRRSREMFGDIWFNSGNFDGKKVVSDGKVKIKPGRNSLPQLVRYLMYVADEMEAKRKQEEALYKQQTEDIKFN
jgi:hypothetical protein